MVSETNKYAEQESSIIDALFEGNYDTVFGNLLIKKFLAILLLMGNVRLPTIGHYWSRDVLYQFNAISKVLSRNRFQEML